MKIATRALLAALLLSLFVVPVFSAPSEGYTISEITFHITGITREGALHDELDELETGLVFPDKEALELFIADQQQQLVNIRQLKESSRIEYETAPLPDGSSAVSVHVYTEDSWNIIVLPIPEYDSNAGFSVTAKYRDQNFFGTLERFALDFSWETKEDDTTYNLDWSFALPFNWAEYQWYWKTGFDWQYENNDHDLATYTSIGVDLPVGLYTPTLTFQETYNYDTADIDRHWLSSRIDFAETVDTGFNLPGFGEFKYTPGIFSEIDYKLDGPISEAKEGLVAGYTHSLSAGRVDWIGNFREGVNFSVQNTNAYNLQHQYWDRDASAELAGYSPLPFKVLFWPFMVSGRAAGFADFDGVDDNAASYLRGVRDTKMGTQAEYGGFINTDLTMSAFTIPDFVEGIGSVYFDAGWVKERDIAYDPEQHFKMGVGLEAIGFPLFARSYFFRLSLGIDLKETLDEGTWRGDNYELFFVLGNHY